MKKITFILLLLFFSYFSKGQNHILSYKKDTLISDITGKPLDSLTWYFPIETIQDTFYNIFVEQKGNPTSENYIEEDDYPIPDCDIRSIQEYSLRYKIPINRLTDKIDIKVDSFKMRWYSTFLYYMDEPVLFNHYLNKEIIRFTWIRAFHQPVCISIEKEGDNIKLVSKMLMGIKADGTMTVITKYKTFVAKDYQKLISLIDTSRIYTYPYENRLCILGDDGAQWIFELHTKEGYHIIDRWSPKIEDNLREIGEFLIRKSDFKKEKIY